MVQLYYPIGFEIYIDIYIYFEIFRKFVKKTSKWFNFTIADVEMEGERW